MARLEISLNGRPYTLACEDGQEARVRQLAAYVDSRVAEVAADRSGGSEAQILMLAGLMLADEILDMQAELEALRRRAAEEPARPAGMAVGVNGAHAANAFEEEAVVNAVDNLAKRIEDIAARLERA